MPSKRQFYCPKCNRTKNEDNFYKSNNLDKYPEGVLTQCKDCLTMHVDNWEPNTYLWILQECDVPYVADEWNKCLATWGKDRASVKGTTIIGRYLSKMKLKQYKDYRWKDTAYLQEVADKKTEEAMKRQGYDAQQIDQALRESRVPIPEPDVILTQPEYENSHTQEPNDDYFGTIYGTEEDDSITESLTDEDKLYLRMKWGKAYKPEEWVQLEKLYNEMMESYDIQTAGHIDTLKMVCKTSLKANQLLDMGDIEAAQKMIKMYDVLMKSGRFTAAQNKAENGEAVDSIAELVAMCEQEGFIPRYYTDGPQDKVDRTLQDLQQYTRTLVTEEMNLSSMIEKAIKEIQEDKEKEALQDADAAGDEDNFEDELFSQDAAFLTDDDFETLKDQINDDVQSDEEYLASLVNEEDMI